MKERFGLPPFLLTFLSLLIGWSSKPAIAVDGQPTQDTIPAHHLLTFKVGDNWTYQVCNALYEPIRMYYFSMEGSTKQIYTVEIKVVRASSGSPSSRAFLVSLKGKTSDSKIDQVNLMYFRQDKQGNVTLVEPNTSQTNTILVPLLPGRWVDNMVFPAASLFGWILKGAGLSRSMRIHRRDLFNVIINGTKDIKIKRLTFHCWRGNVVPPDETAGTALTSDNWYFAPEIGMLVKAIGRYNIDPNSFENQYTHGVFTVQLDSVNLIK